MYGRVESADKAWKKKVGRSEARGRSVGKPRGKAPELWRKLEYPGGLGPIEE